MDDNTEHLVALREAVKAHDIRIAKLEAQDVRITTVLSKIERMQYQIDTLIKELKAHQDALETLKAAPAKRMGSIEGAIWAAVVGGVVSLWISRVM